MTESTYARVRRGSVPDYNDGSDSAVAINHRGETLVSQVLPSKASLAILGSSFNMMIPTASAYTNVAGMPTTRAELALYNPDPVNSYVIDSIYFLSLTSITAAAGVTLIYQVASVAALTDNTAVLINSPVGKVYDGRAMRALAVTTMTANKWAAVASVGAGAAASIGLGVVAEVNGGIIVRPGYTLGLNAVAGTATGTSLIGVSWHEMALPIVG